MDNAADAELERIIADQDRSATFALLDSLANADVTGDERACVVHALASLADPRSVNRLVATAENPTIDIEVRRSALAALANSGLCPATRTLRQWWTSGDVELQKQALVEADRTEADIIGPIARDPTHSLHEQAIRGLEVGFEEPDWQDCKIRALSHRSVAVRRAAANTLLWDEPIVAESGLHGAAADNDDEVAVAAMETLEYYFSRATLARLHSISESGHSARQSAARQSLDRVRDEFLWTLLAAAPQPEVHAQLRDWMSPVWALLNFSDEELRPEPPTERTTAPAGTAATLPPSAADLVASLSDLDGPWEPKLAALRLYDWAALPTQHRPELAQFLVDHPDPAVRAAASRALATWEATERLMQLAHDPSALVRKSAVYHLREVPHSAEVAELTWNLIASGELASIRGYEALRTYAEHAGKDESTDRLIHLARSDQRESIRYEAVCLLDIAEVAAVLPLLTEPPLITWSVHSMLLAICTKNGVTPPSLNHLRDVDNLQIADSLAWFRA